MRALLTTLVCISTAACTTVQPEANQWCSTRLVGNIGLGERLDGIRTVPISEEGVGEAFRILNKKSVISISRKLANRLAVSPTGNVVGFILLVRSGAFASPDATPATVLRISNEMAVSRTFHWRKSDKLLSFYNVQLSDEREQLHVTPLLITAPVNPERAQAFCKRYY